MDKQFLTHNTGNSQSFDLFDLLMDIVESIHRSSHAFIIIDEVILKTLIIGTIDHIARILFDRNIPQWVDSNR